MAAPTEPTLPARRRRPRDRRQQILAVAARQFGELGYNQVSMAAIAETVDIGASALYRHFRGKQDLLVAVLDSTIVEAERIAADSGQLAAALDGLARLMLERREFGAVWDRDLAHLPESDQRELRARIDEVLGRLAVLASAEAGSPAPERDLRAHALWAVLTSPGRHRVECDPDEFAGLVVRAATATLHAAVPGTALLPPRQLPGASPRLPVARREAILAAAVRLFDRRRYPEVGLADIGAAAGIAGPSIYNHFESKTEILTAALARANESLWLALHHALAAADSAADAVERTVGSYVSFAVNNPASVSVLLSEVINLPDQQREDYHRTQQAYVHEWVVLLGETRPHLAEPENRILVHAALGLINDLAREPRLRKRTLLPTEIAVLARAVLGTP